MPDQIGCGKGIHNIDRSAGKVLGYWDDVVLGVFDHLGAGRLGLPARHSLIVPGVIQRGRAQDVSFRLSNSGGVEAASGF